MIPTARLSKLGGIACSASSFQYSKDCCNRLRRIRPTSSLDYLGLGQLHLICLCLRSCRKVSKLACVLDLEANFRFTETDPIEASSETTLGYLLNAINTSLEQSPSFRDMFTRERVETLTPPLADYISMSAAPFAVSDTLLGNRREVRQLLANLQDRCQGDNMLHSQVSTPFPPNNYLLTFRRSPLSWNKSTSESYHRAVGMHRSRFLLLPCLCHRCKAQHRINRVLRSLKDHRRS